jgi:hypothetical protein
MNKRSNRTAAKLALAGLAMLNAGQLVAHHSFAMYDQEIRYALTGVVENLNPDPSHLQIIFVPLNAARDALARDADGERVTWSVEMEGAGASAREGITPSSFPRGTVFSVALMPLRNGQPGGARVGAMFRCPTSMAPEPGMHCDSVEGSIHYGEGELAAPTAIWTP